MTLRQIQAFIAGIDPQAQRWLSGVTDRDYTSWHEIRRLPFMASGRHQEAWAFQIDRFTRDPEDPVAAAFVTATETAHRITCEYQRDYEPDTGYIHHIYSCEGV